jgi:hypothetical protein
MQGFSKCGVRESRYSAKAVYVAQFDSFTKGAYPSWLSLPSFTLPESMGRAGGEQSSEFSIYASHAVKIKIRHHMQPIILDGYPTHDSRFYLVPIMLHNNRSQCQAG